MRSARNTACLAAIAIAAAVAVAGCGAGNPTEGLVSNIDKARNARSLTGLQTGLVALGLAQADAAGGTAATVAAALQAKDPTNRYTTGPPTDVGIIQVLGGGGGAVMLVAINSPPGSGREPYYLAAWQDAGTTRYYAGHQAPVYTPSTPAGAGWGANPPSV